MKFLKKNKVLIFVIVIFLGLVVVVAEVKNLLVPDEGKAAYGNRLDGIEDHKIKDYVYEDMEAKLKEDTKVVAVSHKLHGKIINLIITVSDDTSIEDAKKIANSTIPMFSDDDLKFYTLQVYVKKDNEELNNFPIIGYKGTATKELVFTKDRDIVKEEEEKTNEE